MSKANVKYEIGIVNSGRSVAKEVQSWNSDPIKILKWVLSLIDEPGNTSGDVKQLINEKIFTFTEKKDGSAEEK